MVSVDVAGVYKGRQLDVFTSGADVKYLNCQSNTFAKAQKFAACFQFVSTGPVTKLCLGSVQI